MHSAAVEIEQSATSGAWSRRAPWTGVGFIVFFVVGVVVSSPPSDKASNARWVAAYATHGEQLGHIATGVSLVLAGLCLLLFMTHVWMRVAAARRPQAISPLPVVAAGVTTACMSVGGVLMAAAAGMVHSGAPMPSADLLRFGNDVGFVMIGVPGMLAAAICVACLGIQGHAAGLFGRRLLWVSLVAAAVLLLSFLFLPIAALFIWILVVAFVLMRAAPIRT